MVQGWRWLRWILGVCSGEIWGGGEGWERSGRGVWSMVVVLIEGGIVEILGRSGESEWYWV